MGGTGFEATRATSAAIRGRKVGLQFERGQDHSQEQPRAELLIDDAGILGDPAHPGVFRVDAFDERAGVDIGAKTVISVWWLVVS